LEDLIEGLLGEAEDLGRDLAIDQLFDDEDAGFNMNGLSLGTLVTAMQLAPGAPIPRKLLYAVNAHVQPPARDDGDPDAEPDLDDGVHYFSHAALVLADETIEHLRRVGMFVRHPDDMLVFHESLPTTPNPAAPQIGLAFAEQALLELVPHLFNAQNDALLRRVQPHLRHVTDQLLPLATPNAMALAFLVADYYTTVDPDRDLLRHYATQSCAILDLVIDRLEPGRISWLAHDLYGLAKVAQDVEMDDIAQIAYVRSFELRWRPKSDADEDDEDLVALLSGSPTDTAAMDWIIAELAVATSLACGDTSAARRIADQVRARAEAEIDLIAIRQADYLLALIEQAQGETEQAVQRLYRVVGWCQDVADDPNDLLMVVDLLLVAFIELARLELRAGAVERAERLLDWAAAALDSDAVRDLSPDDPNDPNDTRHRLRARLYEAQALVAWTDGTRETVATLLREAHRLVIFSLGADTRHADCAGYRPDTPATHYGKSGALATGVCALDGDRAHEACL
jgi:hypothetical protein